MTYLFHTESLLVKQCFNSELHVCDLCGHLSVLFDIHVVFLLVVNDLAVHLLDLVHQLVVKLLTKKVLLRFLIIDGLQISVLLL